MTVKRVGVVFPKAAKKGDAKGEKTEETALANVLTELVAVHKAIGDEIAELLKSDPLPDSIKTILGKLKTINDSSRAPELKDLGKSAKSETLRSAVSKLERVMGDLNDDVNRINGVPAALEKAVDTYYRDKADKLADEIEKALPKDVNVALVALKTRMTAFVDKQSKAGWKTYDAAALKLKASVAEDATEALRVIKLREISESFRQTLRYSERDKIFKAAETDTSCTWQKMQTAMQDALTEQETPNKGRWASYLDLGAGGSYTLKDGGSFQGCKIHVTMSKDSWTNAADGSVSLMKGSVADVLSKLLETTDWKQMHATLETPNIDYPHVFLYEGVLKNDTRWDAARDALGRDDKWVTAAQKAMTGILDGVKDRLEKKITEARKVHGGNVY